MLKLGPTSGVDQQGWGGDWGDGPAANRGPTFGRGPTHGLSSCLCIRHTALSSNIYTFISLSYPVSQPPRDLSAHTQGTDGGACRRLQCLWGLSVGSEPCGRAGSRDTKRS
ncbi:hypothetical protein FKM82_022429 [Ascaphus truei]